MGKVVQFRDYEKANLPTTPWCQRAAAMSDLRDKQTARIFEISPKHETKRIYPSAKLLPPVFFNEKPKS